MFDKFGEFDSVEELNKKAAELKAADNEKELIALAEENGLTRDDAEDYMDDCVPEFATVLQAAVGKIRVEAQYLGISGILEDWKNAVLDMCMENTQMQVAVRRKEKKLCECMALLVKFAFENKVRVSEEIVKVCKIKHNGKLEQMRSPLYLGVPNKATVKKIVTEYYLGQETGE